MLNNCPVKIDVRKKSFGPLEILPPRSPKITNLQIFIFIVSVANKIYNLAPKDFSESENVIECDGIGKVFKLVGREE